MERTAADRKFWWGEGYGWDVLVLGKALRLAATSSTSKARTQHHCCSRGSGADTIEPSGEKLQKIEADQLLEP